MQSTTLPTEPDHHLCRIFIKLSVLNNNVIIRLHTTTTNSSSQVVYTSKISLYTDVEEVADKSVSDDSDGALPEGGAVKLTVRVE